VSRPSQAQHQATQQERVKTTASACAAVQKKPIRYDAADTKASAALPQSSQTLGAFKGGLGTLGTAAGGAAAALALQRLTKPDRGTLTVRVATRPVWMGPEFVTIGAAIMLRWPNKFVIITAAKHTRLSLGENHRHWQTTVGTIKCGAIRIGIIGGDRLPGQSRLPGSLGWSSPGPTISGECALRQRHVYMNGQRVATADEYYQQASQLASTARDDTADKTEWLPLAYSL